MFLVFEDRMPRRGRAECAILLCSLCEMEQKVLFACVSKSCRWDEWVTSERIKKYNEANLLLKAQMEYISVAHFLMTQ